MRTSIIPQTVTPLLQEKPAMLEQLARRLILQRFSQLQYGSLEIREGNQSNLFGQADAGDARVIIEVLHPQAWAAVAFGGSCAVGESYVRGLWRCNDLTRLARLFLRNREVLQSLDRGSARLQAPLLKLLHWLNRNSRSGSRRNIAAHYDIGNALFELFLDSRMMYSSAVYEHKQQSLEDAARHKLDLICRKLDLQPGDHLLEIGSGWGGMAIHAARHYGCRVTTTTISEEQYQLTRQRVAEQGLQNTITVLLKDYRELDGQFDKAVSIEMVEAVGHQFLNGYFRQLCQRLKPDGVALIQAITITDQHYQQALTRVDFIKRYIFPGGFLPSISVLSQAMSQASDLKMVHLEDIGNHYARTLADWRQRFFEQLPQIRALGYNDEFVRLWDYYLCYCEAGFRERYLGTVQMLLTRPGAPHPRWLGEAG